MYMLGPLFLMLCFSLLASLNIQTDTVMNNLNNNSLQDDMHDIKAFSGYVREMGQAIRRYGREALDNTDILLHAQICDQNNTCTGMGNYEGTTPAAWNFIQREPVIFCRGLTLPPGPDGEPRDDTANGARMELALDTYGQPLPDCTDSSYEPFTKSFSAGEALRYGFSNVLFGEDTLISGRRHYTMYSWVYKPKSTQASFVKLFDDGMIGTKRGDILFLNVYPDTQVSIPAEVAALIPDGSAVVISYPIPDLPGWRDDSGD